MLHYKLQIGCLIIVLYICYIYLKIDGKVAAKLKLIDDIKKDSISAILELKKQNIKTFMFTGDKKKSAEEIAKKTGVDEVFYEMLPDDKYKKLDNIIKENERK